MIAGRVNERNEAIIPVQMRGGIPPLEAVIDTGFQGADLLLPQAVIALLGLEPAGHMTLRLANEQEARFAYYNGEAMWHNGYRRAKVLASENECLVGADFLAGSRICMDMIPGGTVTIDELPFP